MTLYLERKHCWDPNALYVKVNFMCGCKINTEHSTVMLSGHEQSAEVNTVVWGHSIISVNTARPMTFSNYFEVEACANGSL